MAKFDSKSAIAALELQQLVSEYFLELDTTYGMNSHEFYTEDGVIDIGKMSFRGHDQIRKFYESLAELVKTQEAAGIRTTRHVYTNLRITFDGDDRAIVDFIAMNFSRAGTPPLSGATTPSVVSDARLRCRRDGDGQWRIAELSGAPVFIGDDPVQNKVLVD